MAEVRTRFAPSPTGYMHIGGMRTALFNWLWARHNGGKFILRIDDTDQQRNLQEALDPILRAFRWLGLDWDEGPEVGGPCGPYFQSQRGELYRAAVERLLASGQAFKDFDPPELVQADREQAQREKRNYLNVRRSIDLTQAQRKDLENRGAPYVVRFLVDRSARVSIHDAVRGHVTWDCSIIPDPVIMRANGTPLYNFASVVDDAQLSITHVIRAEEHLTNTAVQVMLFQALGYPLPEFAHIPFVAAPGTTKKLSKRDLGKYRNNPQFRKLFAMAENVLPKLGLSVSEALNPVMVSFYEELGFLPEAIVNGLARLGWSWDDQTEIMSRAFIVEHFSLDRVVKSSAGLDPDKLLAFQEHWMAQLTIEQKVEGVLPFLIRAGWVADPPADAMRLFISRLVIALGERLKVFSDVLNYDEYFVADEEMTWDEKAFEKRLVQAENAAALLQEYRDVLAEAPSFTASDLEAQMHRWLELRGMALGEVVHAVRLAVTGKPAGPGLFECLALLGKERCLARIDRTLARCRG